MPQTDIAGDLRTWKSYEYLGPEHYYHDVRYESAGGLDGGHYVWTDDSMWSIDSPAQPQAILPFIRYQFWLAEPPADLRQATLRLALRGDGLNLHGGQCFFWIATYAPGARLWHHIGQPLAISDGKWSEAVDLTLRPEADRWQQSLTAAQGGGGSIHGALGACFSYGLSFLGFSRKVTGRLALGAFNLLVPGDTGWPFVFNQRCRDAAWLTVSRGQRQQIPVTASPATGLHLKDDFMLVKEAVPFCYLAYLQAGPATGRRDLRQAVLMVQHNTARLDGKGGKVAFFVEHAASGTRWVLRVPIEARPDQPWYQILPDDESLWFRLSGPLPLADLLGGKAGGARYDYLGLMLVGAREEPSGSWELSQLSLGPTVELAP